MVVALDNNFFYSFQFSHSSQSQLFIKSCSDTDMVDVIMLRLSPPWEPDSKYFIAHRRFLTQYLGINRKRTG